MTVRAPSLLVAALCLGVAGATLARVAMLRGCRGGRRGRSPQRSRRATGGRASAPPRAPSRSRGWWWGSPRLAALDRSVLAARVGTAERALVEIEEPPRPGRYETRVRALVVRWGRSPSATSRCCSSSRPAEPRPRARRSRCSGSCASRAGRRTASTSARWLRRHGVHVVLRAETWRVVGRRGGLGGVADRLHALARRATARRGSRGERRAVLEGVVLGEDQGLSDTLKQRFRACGPLPPARGERVERRVRRRRRARAAAALRRLAALGRGGGARRDRRLRARGRPAAVGDPGRSRRRARLARLAHGTGARPSGTRCCWPRSLLLAWNPYLVLDAGFQLSFAAVLSIFLVAPRLRRALDGYPLPRWLRTRSGDLGRVQPRHRAGLLVPVPSGLARRRAGQRRGGPRGRADARARAPLGGCSRLWRRPLAARARASRTAGAPPTSPAARGSSAACPAPRCAPRPRPPRSPPGVLLAAAYAWRRGERAQAGLSPHRQRPPEDRARAAPAAGPHRR